jgi:hypothetical protein
MYKFDGFEIIFTSVDPGFFGSFIFNVLLKIYMFRLLYNPTGVVI